MSEKIDVKLPSMDTDAAENFIGGGHLAMTFLNYLEQNPDIMYQIYPGKSKFIEAEERFGITQDEIRHQFVTANRRALMVVSYVFKYIANQVIDHYNVEADQFTFNVENKLMMKDLDEKDPKTEELIESEVFDELHKILGGLN
jgi:hypothetical protein